MGKVFVIGIGPGEENYMTPAAKEGIISSDIIIGYKTYIDLIRPFTEGKKVIDSGMKKEIERCNLAVDLAEAGSTVALVSSGDPGIYGMAGALLEVKHERKSPIEIEVIPGVTAVSAAAAVLGAPLMHDFAVISLSDLLTDWEVIKKRLALAGEGDFVIALYNPKSKGRVTQIEEARSILLQHRKNSTPVGIVRNAKRQGEEMTITTLEEMLLHPIDMFTMVIIGNSNTLVQDGKMITPRGYHL
ncbi:precorrin-3B C(17)-methyltransferase [Clostridium formicaceticum]|uniref:Precorrin-3B C(17)-methyltransferase n=1 Tax=Clostridium formicaceticum TaxID=1497 RepID=A0AAC9WEL4_9CLOT|nr:precorrin-3B C(17)-methyltransferase [Clostridium formicaceticum]AOY75468.1 precorrin-3B C(17)-methyltransferase [Clostridium formicaceticum]ARE85753.1 Cobalt-precorrin-3B C(17)-methyltransferase [Clostridium formicaceticum]